MERGPEIFAAWDRDPTSARAVSLALDDLWREAGKALQQRDGQGPGPCGVVRAGVLNLLAYVTTPEGCRRATAVMHELTAIHPGRTILLHSQREATPDGIGGAALAYRHPGAGVCSDQVELHARGSATARLASAAAWLARHELPTLLWWLEEPLVEDDGFGPLAEVSDLVVVDSAELTSPLAQLPLLARFAQARERPVIADLNWDRLLDWREVTAQFFDAPRSRQHLADLGTVEIVYVEDPRRRGASAQALLFAGWLASSLAWKPVEASRGSGATVIRLRGAQGMGVLTLRGVRAHGTRGSLHRLELRGRGDTPAGRFTVAAETGGGHGTTTSLVDGGAPVTRGFRFEEASEARLLAQEIESLGAHRALGPALASAAEIARLLEEPKPVP